MERGYWFYMPGIDLVKFHIMTLFPEFPQVTIRHVYQG